VNEPDGPVEFSYHPSGCQRRALADIVQIQVIDEPFSRIETAVFFPVKRSDFAKGQLFLVASPH
jgi:hypothetical protein